MQDISTLKKIENRFQYFPEIIQPQLKIKSDLGQYFTPLTVVEFIYKMLFSMMKDIDKQNPRIIDPACGEGIFLKYAIDKKLTISDQIYGMDIDPDIKTRWKKEELLNKINLYNQDGLLDTPDRKVLTERDEQIIKRFDIVIGNPPYGGIGIKDLENNKSLMFKIRKYQLWQKARLKIYQNKEQTELFSVPDLESDEKLQPLYIFKDMPPEFRPLKLNEKQRIENTPIEIFFLERFIQLARPNKWIAIIIPDGILANTNYQYIRDWVLKKADIKAIISLPRETFKNVRTTAKTSILFLRKRGKDKPYNPNADVFLAIAEYVGIANEKNDLPEILEKFKSFKKKL